jgi:hypothetical protein
MRSMENATRSFENNKRPAGRLHAYQALTQLNESILELLDAQQSMCGGAGCGGIPNAMQKLMGLTQQQMDINRGTQQLLQQKGRGRLTESGRERLARMAAEQRMVQQGLEEAAQSLDQRRDVLGRLGDLANEMEELAEEMERSHLDERLVKRQQRFLSRLLDAQRSVRKRDLGRERKSRVGVQHASERPSALPEKLLTAREKMRADILRGRTDQYPAEYRELVERYFQALAARGATGEETRSQ